MRASGPALWRRQRRHRSGPLWAQPAGAGGGVTPLHAGDDPLRRPAYRCDGARHGHQRAGHGLVHGHLLHVPGPHGDGDRHRKAGGCRRHCRAARGHRTRSGSSDRPRHGKAEHQLERSHRRHPGVRQCRQRHRGDAGAAGYQGDRRVGPHGVLLRSPRSRRACPASPYGTARRPARLLDRSIVRPGRSADPPVRHPGTRGDGAGDHRRYCPSATLPDPRRRRERPYDTRGRSRARRAARRDFRHSRHPVQRRRRGRQLLRVGAGPAAAVLDRTGGARPAQPRSGTRIPGSNDTLRARSCLPPHVGLGDRYRKGAES